LPTFGTIKAPDGTILYWKMITPPLEPGKRYPVFVEHYGGPTGEKTGWCSVTPTA
jgi:dipeptidyl-peptidase-4